MKKYLILLLLTTLATFSSCSDDDDDERDLIVGNWILETVEPDSFFNPQACTEISTVQINGDNTLTTTLYFEQDNCDGVTGDGTWEKTGASSYRFEFPEIGTLNGTVSHPSPERMLFTSENDLVLSFLRE